MLIGWFAEKHYISRIGILPNLLPVAYILVVDWNSLFVVGQIWLVIGCLIGILGLLAYYQRWSIPAWIHGVAYALYSLKTVVGIYVGILLVSNATLGFIIGVFIAVLIWWIGVTRFNNDIPFT